MRRPALHCGSIFLALLLSSAPAFADVIELKNGQRVEGVFKSASPGSIVVEVGGQELSLDRDKECGLAQR